MRALLSALVSLLLPPCIVKNTLLRLSGWKIGDGCRIGFSFIRADTINLQEGSRVGNLNFISLQCIILRQSASIGHLNKITGPFILALEDKAAVGNENRVIRAPRTVSWGRSMLRLKFNSKITSGHVIDCTRPVIFSSNSILAGRGSQIWSHGYLHAREGTGRFRIDGSVFIGNNVYIGSSSVINAGVNICSGATIGSGSCVSRSITRSGLYVGQALRYLPLDFDEAAARYPTVKAGNLVETVKIKKR
ncbi:hypothetical protein IRZ74_23845 [Pseudomonas monteilii]|nr:hypothetical protein [Pseudomonas monteilii]